MADTLLAIDNNLADEVQFYIGDVGDTLSSKLKVDFQFPPKILNDGRSGTWEEYPFPGSQPIAYWKTSGARKWSLEWSYVIGARGWDTSKVKTQITSIRSYWEMRKGENYAGNLIVRFWMWKLGGDKYMTCRITDIDVTHSKAIYVPNGGLSMDDRKSAYPVVTNVKVAMQIWTNGLFQTSAKEQEQLTGGARSAIKKASDAKIAISGLRDYTYPDWQ